MDWVAGSTRSPLLSELCFRNRLRYRVVVLVPSTVSSSWEHDIIAARIEKLCGHHHLLLLAGIGIGRLPLINQVEQVGLVRRGILVPDATRRPDPVVPDARGGRAERARSPRVPVMLRHHRHVVLARLRRPKVVDRRRVPGVALAQLRHEVTVEHCLPHLHLLVSGHLIRSTMVAARAEPANARLVEDLLVLGALAVDRGQHVVDPRVVRRLQHDACVRRVHLVDVGAAAISTNDIAATALLPHPVRHEESLVWLLRAEPI